MSMVRAIHFEYQADLVNVYLTLPYIHLKLTTLILAHQSPQIKISPKRLRSNAFPFVTNVEFCMDHHDLHIYTMPLSFNVLELIRNITGDIPCNQMQL